MQQAAKQSPAHTFTRFDKFREFREFSPHLAPIITGAMAGNSLSNIAQSLGIAEVEIKRRIRAVLYVSGTKNIRAYAAQRDAIQPSEILFVIKDKIPAENYDVALLLVLGHSNGDIIKQKRMHSFTVKSKIQCLLEASKTSNIDEFASVVRQEILETRRLASELVRPASTAISNVHQLQRVPT